MYADVMLPWTNVKVVSKLCIGGLCKYALKEKVGISNNWLMEHVVPGITVYDDGQAAAVCPDISSRIKVLLNRMMRCIWKKNPDLDADVACHVGGYGHGRAVQQQNTEMRANLVRLGTDLNKKILMLYDKVSAAGRCLEAGALRVQHKQEQPPAAVADYEEGGDGMPSFMATLSRCPWDSHVLWKEYKF
eukprot:4074539-Ditylum_brightwellii.AAC.1